MKFKVLTISKHTKEYGYCIEGLTYENQYFRFFQGNKPMNIDFFEQRDHTYTYYDIRYAYKKNKDLYFLRDVEINNSLLDLLYSNETDNITLAIELIRNKKEG